MARDGRVSVQKAHDAIYRALTQDFDYGTKKDGTPLKRPKHNQALFDAQGGWQVFNGTDLGMVMEAVTLGLMLATGQERAAADKGEVSDPLIVAEARASIALDGETRVVGDEPPDARRDKE